MASKRQLTAQETSELMTSNPQRTDVYLDYNGTARQLNSIEWTVDQMWDVWASGMRFSFLKNAHNFFQMVEDTPSPEPTETPTATSKPKLTAAQKTALEYLHREGAKVFNRFHGRREEIPFDSLANKELAHQQRRADGMREYVLTAAGQALAVEMFGTPEQPAATPSPEPTQETEQPMASSKPKLTAAQERELKLIATHQIDRGGAVINPYHKDKTTLKLWAKLVELGLVAAEYLNVRETRYTLTDAGREKVAPLFTDATLFASEPVAAPQAEPTTSQYDDETRSQVWKEIREFYRNATGNTETFYAEFGHYSSDLSDAAIDEWRYPDGLPVYKIRERASEPQAAPVVADDALPFAAFDDSEDVVQDSGVEAEADKREMVLVRYVQGVWQEKVWSRDFNKLLEHAGYYTKWYIQYVDDGSMVADSNSDSHLIPPRDPQPPAPTKTTRFTNTGSQGIVNGHGRTSKPRKASKTAQIQAISKPMIDNTKKTRRALKQAEIRANYANRQRTVTPITRKQRNPHYLEVLAQAVMLDVLMGDKAA